MTQSTLRERAARFAHCGRMRALLTVPALALALAGCVTPTVYGPVATASGSGYVDTRLQSDRYRVTFRGGSDADRNRVTDLALLRAAQLTLEAGYDWFRVIDRYGEVRPPRGPTLSLGTGTTSYDHNSAVGFGIGAGNIPLGGGPTVSETVEIIMARGQTPRESDAYDARELTRAIQPG